MGTLSKEIVDIQGLLFINKLHIKEFIKKLEKKSKKGWNGYIGLVHIDDIKELAGKELI